MLKVEPGSPRDLAGVERDAVKSVDGVDIGDQTEAGLRTVFEGLNPNVAAKTTAFGLQADGSNEIDEVVVVSSSKIATNPVEIAKWCRSVPAKSAVVLTTEATCSASESVINGL